MWEGVGDDMDICIELHHRLTLAEAAVFARGTEEYYLMLLKDLRWFEDADAMARFADKIHTSIATSERFSTLYEFQALFTRNVV